MLITTCFYDKFMTDKKFYWKRILNGLY